MVEARAGPGLGIVASIAARSVASPVIIVVRVAARAGQIELLRFRVARVTAPAFEWCVFPPQCKACLHAVVESRARPCEGSMALIARRAQSPAMCVVVAVAARAVGRGGVETFLRVAERAVGVGVTPFEWKASRAVVEARRRPSDGCVAIVASSTE